MTCIIRLEMRTWSKSLLSAHTAWYTGEPDLQINLQVRLFQIASNPSPASSWVMPHNVDDLAWWVEGLMDRNIDWAVHGLGGEGWARGGGGGIFGQYFLMDFFGATAREAFCNSLPLQHNEYYRNQNNSSLDKPMTNLGKATFLYCGHYILSQYFELV